MFRRAERRPKTPKPTTTTSHCKRQLFPACVCVLEMCVYFSERPPPHENETNARASARARCVTHYARDHIVSPVLLIAWNTSKNNNNNAFAFASREWSAPSYRLTGYDVIVSAIRTRACGLLPIDFHSQIRVRRTTTNTCHANIRMRILHCHAVCGYTTRQ